MVAVAKTVKEKNTDMMNSLIEHHGEDLSECVDSLQRLYAICITTIGFLRIYTDLPEEYKDATEYQMAIAYDHTSGLLLNHCGVKDKEEMDAVCKILLNIQSNTRKALTEILNKKD